MFILLLAADIAEVVGGFANRCYGVEAVLRVLADVFLQLISQARLYYAKGKMSCAASRVTKKNSLA